MTMKAQRIEDLLIYIKQNKTVELDHLCQVFDVSKNTIRRDIDLLHKEGKIEKVYGGVIYIDHTNLIPFTQRNQVLGVEKRRIGSAAANLVNDGDIIFIDAGSTAAHMLPFLSEKKNLTIITNSLTVLNEALPMVNTRVISTGGDLLRDTNSFTGIEAIRFLSNYNIHKAFVAASGVSVDNGLTNSSSIEAEIKKAVLNVSGEITLLSDHTKFGNTSLVTFAHLKDVSTIVTDTPLSQAFEDFCQKHQINIITA